jgi:hypothetical protein
MTGEEPTASEPWQLYDMFLLYGFSAVGLGLLLLAWWGVSGTATTTHQIVWVNVAVVSVMVLGTGNCMWLLSGRRAVGERRQRVLAAFESVSVEPLEVAGPVGEDRPVAANGMRHYHRAGCQLVRGKSATATTLSAHGRAGRQPCGMCQP